MTCRGMNVSIERLIAGLLIHCFPKSADFDIHHLYIMKHWILAVAIVVAPFGTAANSAVECKAELPAARTGYWSWRNVDGKQCWYEGRPGMSKASLEWPRTVPLPPRPPMADRSNGHAPHEQEADASLEQEAADASPADASPALKELPFAERWPR